MVDEKKISFNPAVELSYLDKNQQRDFLEAMSDTQNSPSLSQAQRLKKLAQEGHFSYDVAFAVMGEPKKDELDKVVIKTILCGNIFPKALLRERWKKKSLGFWKKVKPKKLYSGAILSKNIFRATIRQNKSKIQFSRCSTSA